MSVHRIRFHNHHGSNIVLGENNLVAYRKASFAHAIVFSDRPLLPNELFLVQITQTEPGWNGHFRLGLTHFNPNLFLPLPQVAFPDLMALAPTWIFSELKRTSELSGSLFEDALVGHLPNDVGAQVGLFFKAQNDIFADLHFVVNGIDQGRLASDLLYKESPLYVVIDVYGTTKKVEIVHFHEVVSLQTACKKVILQTMAQKAVGSLPLPKTLKEFLLHK